MNMHEFYLPDPTEGDLQKKKIIEQKKARIIELEKNTTKAREPSLIFMRNMMKLLH